MHYYELPVNRRLEILNDVIADHIHSMEITEICLVRAELKQEQSMIEAHGKTFATEKATLKRLEEMREDAYQDQNREPLPAITLLYGAKAA